MICHVKPVLDYVEYNGCHTLRFFLFVSVLPNDDFVTIMRMMYADIQSAVCINGIVSDFFPVKRSIRQGCPMSMIAYVLFQEPQYRMIMNNSKIIPITLPNGFNWSIVGFADDSTALVSTVGSVTEVFNVVEKFEQATGALLNREKTSVMGLGVWEDKNTWPLAWLKSVNERY